ncbi:hypothetical protein C0989_011089 [Termitomyces sp. Mn162]|nr:hypothetical protein C0989_011089 [Termitomyces sp. Mn162]
MTIEGAHVKGTETGSMIFSVDGHTVLTRGGDDTVKCALRFVSYNSNINREFVVWDLRAFKKPLATRSELATLYPHTNAMFSPDDKHIITGAGATAKGGKVVLYSPTTSLNGAKLLANKGPPRKVTIEDMSDALAAPSIITPHALPMFRDMDPGRGTKRKAEKDRLDPRKSRRPELPVTGPGKGGRVGASATQHVVQNLVRDTTRDEDVNQPQPVFAPVSDEEEDEK